jgi:hypothetical protein
MKNGLLLILLNFFFLGIVANATPKPSIVQVEKNGTLRLSAEKGKAIGPEIKYMPEWRAYGWFTAADRVEWQVQVPETGIYQVSIEYSVDNLEAGKQFILFSSSANLKGIVARSGSWETYKVVKVGVIKLNKGVQKITFKSQTKFAKGAILDLREIRLSQVNKN